MSTAAMVNSRPVTGHVHTTLKFATESCSSTTRLAVQQPRGPGRPSTRRGPRRILQLGHVAPGQAVVTCQMLPADFPGHAGYCPTPPAPRDRIWHSPDIAKPGAWPGFPTTNMPVTVSDRQGLREHGSGLLLGRVLGDGYRASSEQCPMAFFSRGRHFHSKVQAGLDGWAPTSPPHRDSSSASSAAARITRTPRSNVQLARFCARTPTSSAARRAASPHPATALRLSAEVDRIVTDQAPSVPILNEVHRIVSARIGKLAGVPRFSAPVPTPDGFRSDLTPAAMI